MNALNRNAAAALLCVAAAFAAGGAGASGSYTWKGDANASWQSADSYLEGGVPQAGDVVVVSTNAHPVVTDADADFVGRLSKVTLLYRCSIEFNVENDHELSCEIRQDESQNASYTLGVYIRKSGAGTLTLSAPYTVYMYRAGIEINAGRIRLGDVADYGSEDNAISFVSLNVADGAMLELNGSAKLNIGRLFGAGDISNGWDRVSSFVNIQRDGSSSEFSGRLLGNILFKANTSSSSILLSGVESDFHTIRMYENGSVSVAKIGNTGEPSSIGTNGTVNLLNGGHLVYVGTGETTDKEFPFKDISTPTEIDAGATGDVTFTGRWGYHSSPRRMRRLVINGSNTVKECVIAGPWYEMNAVNGTNFATYITKKGSGIWRAADNAERNHRGVWAVEDGTLRFDSVAEAGTVCSLGLSTVLFDDVSDAVRLDERSVPYALLLGGEDTEGILEYTGSSRAYCSTRPIGVKGAARLRNATDCAFFWKDVFGVGGGAKSLTLDGDSTVATNRLDTITNACGTLSIVKDGLGDWTLAGDVAFNGSLEVKKGRLTILRGRTTPTWFRWNIMQNFAKYGNEHEGASNKKGDSFAVQVDEFALYSAEGVRLNCNLAQIDDWTSLGQGQTALMQGLESNPDTSNRKLASIFSDTPDSTKYGNLKTGQTDVWMSPEATNSWIRIVMRLADDSAPVASYDYANLNGSSRPSVYAYSLETSFDGVTWTVVTNVMDSPRHNYRYQWESNGDTITSKAVRPLPAGFPLDVPVRTMRYGSLGAVSVSSGAELKADIRDGGEIEVCGLVVDCDEGIGSFENITFAANGTVDVRNLPDGGVEFSPTLTGCEGFSNVAGWTLTRNGGEPATKIRMSVSGGKIRFIPLGTMISIR